MINANIPENDPYFNEPETAYCEICDIEHENDTWCQAYMENE